MAMAAEGTAGTGTAATVMAAPDRAVDTAGATAAAVGDISATAWTGARARCRPAPWPTPTRRMVRARDRARRSSPAQSSTASTAARPLRCTSLSAPDGGVAPVEETGSAEEVTLEDRTLYVLRDGQPLPVDVTLGLSDGSYTEVVSGNLHEGDEVILDATVNGGSSSSSGGGSKSSGGGGNRNGGGPPRMF